MSKLKKELSNEVKKSTTTLVENVTNVISDFIKNAGNKLTDNVAEMLHDQKEKINKRINTETKENDNRRTDKTNGG